MEIKKVLYYIQSQKKIKFIGDDSNIFLAEDFEYPNKLVKNDEVEVDIKDGKVVSIFKVNKEKKIEEKTEVVEEKTEEVAEEKVKVEKKVVTVFAVSGNKEVMKTDKNSSWIKLSKKLQEQDIISMGFKAGNEVELTLCNGIISGFKVLNEKKASNKEEKTSSQTYGRNENGMDKRTALMCAKDIVIALINNDKIDKKLINEAIDDLSKSFVNTLTKL